MTLVEVGREAAPAYEVDPLTATADRGSRAVVRTPA
jgi:hypothetical protein